MLGFQQIQSVAVLDSHCKLDKPIIVIGAPRSGTTLLGNILKHHKSLAYSEEPRLIWRYGNDKKSDMLRVSDATDKVRHYIRNAFNNYVTRLDRDRLCEKTPSNSLRIEFVNAVFPDCKFVHIMRNPVESVLSIRDFWTKHAHGLSTVPVARIMDRLKEISPSQIPYYGKELIRRTMPKPFRLTSNVWGPRFPGIDQMLKELDLLEICSMQWRLCVETACRQGRLLPEDRYMEVNLEQLNPAKMRQIIDFCELQDDEDVNAAFAERYDPNKASHRRAENNSEDVAKIMKWVEPTMAWLEHANHNIPGKLIA